MAKFDAASGKVGAFGILATLSGTTPAKGNIVDLLGFNSATLFLVSGAVTDAGTAAGYAFEIQESDTTADAAFTAVADSDLIGTEAALTVTDDAADSTATGVIGYVGSKRYVRVVATGTSGTNASVAGSWALENPYIQPAADQTATNIAAT
jgi:hypothetical protein